MMRKLTNYLPVVTMTTVLGVVALAALGVGSAGAVETGLNVTAGTAGFSTSGAASEGLTFLIAGIIKQVLQLVGVVFLVLMIYGGLRWMTAGGNDEQVKAAKELIKNAVIGLVIILAAYIITDFVLQGVLMATDTGAATGPPET